MTIRTRLHRTWTVVGELTSRLCTFVPNPPEHTTIRPEHSTRSDVHMREHG